MRGSNLILEIEEELLQAAHAVAVQRQTTINDMVRQYLKKVVGDEGRRGAAWEQIKELVEQPSVVLGEARLSRDALHER